MERLGLQDTVRFVSGLTEQELVDTGTVERKRSEPLKSLLNAVAVVCFVIAGQVAWAPAFIMLASSVAGGYLGARVARKMNPDHVRAIIIAIGFAMSVAFFARQYS